MTGRFPPKSPIRFTEMRIPTLHVPGKLKDNVTGGGDRAPGKREFLQIVFANDFRSLGEIRDGITVGLAVFVVIIYIRVYISPLICLLDL